MGGEDLSYKVQRFEVDNGIDELDLERFLNELTGEIISIVLNIIPKFHMMGATTGYDDLIIVERLEE